MPFDKLRAFDSLLDSLQVRKKPTLANGANGLP
jgi:hypothetical protein